MRVLIVDDEPWARKRIASLLQAERDVHVTSECATGASAIQSILQSSPDLIFLDVKMPDMNGFEVLDALAPERIPAVIFATAFDSYAIRAFDASALDYLLKPFDEARFRLAVDRARKEMAGGQAQFSHRISTVLEGMAQHRRYLQRIVVKHGGRIVFLKACAIERIEATGNYITLHSRGETHLLRETMNGIEPKLDPQQFIRAHRSTIVNLDQVKQIEPWFRGELALILKDGTSVTVGRAYYERLRRLTENITD